MERIRPSADLRNHYSELSRVCREERKPIYITVNGRGDTVLMGMAEYERMCSELELLRMLADSEEDARNGRLSPVQNTFDELRQELQSRAQR